jgi:two-component system KDP operon response regulator KdpE
VVNLALRQVLVNRAPVALTPIEYEIMRTLVTHAGRVLTHAQIIQAVWSGNDEADSHLLRVNISNLRKKIEKDPLRPLHIVTEPGVGFRLRDPEAQQ